MWSYCWHDWSKWTTYVWEGTSIRALNIGRTMQVRVCSKCGKEIHRVVDHAAGATHAEATRTGKMTPAQAR